MEQNTIRNMTAHGAIVEKQGLPIYGKGPALFG